MVHSVSSDWQISEGGSCARNHEPLEGLSHEQHANEFNFAQYEHRWRAWKTRMPNRTEKYTEVLQLSSGPSQDAAERSENSKNSKIRFD